MMAHHSRWQPASPQTIPAHVRPWLLDHGSLTARLLAASDGHFRVQLLHHGWAKASPDEREALGLGSRDATLVREVLLRCHDEPWVYARSILPARALRGRHRHLRSFGARSLGAYLFSRVDIQRDPFEVARMPSTALPPEAGRCDAGVLLWARRSRFYLDNEPVLVAEVFLPAFQPWTAG